MTLNIRRLAQLIKAERVDLVHARSRAPAWVAYGATRIVKTPFVTSFQGSYARGGPLALRYNSIMARGDCIIADSARTADRIEELYPAAKDKVRIIVGGVDCRVFAPKAVSPARVQAVRRLWGAASDERIVLLAAGPRSSSDYKILVEAVRLLADHDAAGIGAGATKFIVAAEAPPVSFAREIEAAIAKAGLQGIMRLSGAGPDRPAALLAASAVVALSANPEAFAGLALEAQAMGAPVIVATQSAAAETVLAPPLVDETARSGWPTPSDAAALARALSEVLNLGATARDRLSLRARAHVEAHFPIEQMWAQTLAAYASARGDVR
jgi:glycosyltransferase involved in cell wall biosynthesis